MPGCASPSGSASIGPARRGPSARCWPAPSSSPVCRGAATAAPSGARRVLRNTLLQTTYPASWRARLEHLDVAGQHVTEYSLSSTGAPLNGDAIPPAGAIGITVYVYPDADRAPADAPVPAVGRSRSRRGPADRARCRRHPAPGAVRHELSPVRLTTLGGRGAARVTYLYEYGDDYNLNLQDDVVAVRGHTIVQVELDIAPALQAGGESALRALLDAWRWRRGPATMAS